MHRVDEEERRVKDALYWVRKLICSLIQMMFLAYEFLQFSKVKNEYWEDYWNLFEVLGIITYAAAAFLDMGGETLSDACRILYVLSLLFSLFKVLYLIRVFK